jgi:predicted N-acetyltransferase YhbS
MNLDDRMSPIAIRPLADRPDAVGLLAEWFCTEWNTFDGRSRWEIEAQLRGNLSRDALPITFVALSGADVIGTVSLDASDLPAYDHLSPWLACLYVVPSQRSAGVGQLLVHHAVAFAREREVSSFFLWSPGSTRLYEKCGWRIFRTDVYGARPITLMELAFQVGQDHG